MTTLYAPMPAGLIKPIQTKALLQPLPAGLIWEGKAISTASGGVQVAPAFTRVDASSVPLPQPFETRIRTMARVHNARNRGAGRARLTALRTVYRRGANAYRGDPAGRDEHAVARVRAHLSVLAGTATAPPSYRRDDDLLPSSHPRRRKVQTKAWDTHKHPRDHHGRFVSLGAVLSFDDGKGHHVEGRVVDQGKRAGTVKVRDASGAEHDVATSKATVVEHPDLFKGRGTPAPKRAGFHAAHTGDARPDGKEFGHGYSAADPRNDPAYDRYTHDLNNRIDRITENVGDTETLFDKIHDDGEQVYSAERRKAHDKIIADKLKEYAAVPSDREALFMAGPPGAGKSSIIKSHGDKFGVQMVDDDGPRVGNFATVNPDDMKQELIDRGLVPKDYGRAGVTENESASFLHEESSHLAKRLQRELAAKGKNILVDGTFGGNDPSKQARKVRELNDLGYTTHGVLVDVPIEQSFKGAGRRHIKGGNGESKPFAGRYVPYSHIEAQAATGEHSEVLGRAHRSVNAQNFEAAHREGAFSGDVHYFDNEGFAGRHLHSDLRTEHTNAAIPRGQGDTEPDNLPEGRSLQERKPAEFADTLYANLQNARRIGWSTESIAALEQESAAADQAAGIDRSKSKRGRSSSPIVASSASGKFSREQLIDFYTQMHGKPPSARQLAKLSKRKSLFDGTELGDPEEDRLAYSTGAPDGDTAMAKAIADSMQRTPGSPPNLERKAAAPIVLDDDGDGLISAIVSVTGIVDYVNDRIYPGAYADSLQKRIPKGVWSHEWKDWVSRTEGIEELMPGDPRLPATMPDGTPWPPEAGGLLVKTRFAINTTRGLDAYNLVRFFDEAPDINGVRQGVEWSIGYNVPPGDAVREKGGVRGIKRMAVFEYGPQLWGAAPGAASTEENGSGKLAYV